MAQNPCLYIILPLHASGGKVRRDISYLGGPLAPQANRGGLSAQYERGAYSPMKVLTWYSTGHTDHPLPPPVLLDRFLLPHLVCRRDKRQSREVIWGDELEVAGTSRKQLGVIVFMPALQEGLDRVRHLGGRSQTRWPRWPSLYHRTRRLWLSLQCSFLSTEDTRLERLNKDTDA